MPKEILLYSPIYTYSAADYITQLETNKGSDIVVRMNCPGGDVYSAYGMIAKFAEHKKKKSIKVDGQAKSGGFYMLCYAEDVECLDVSDFMVHRAALPSYIENDPTQFTPEVKAMLTRINTALRAGIESKVTAAKFKEVTGVSLDEMFSLDTRIDVNITAAEAKEMGLVQTITPLTKETKAQILSLSSQMGIAAFSKDPVVEEPKPQPQISQPQNKIMTLAEFKTLHAAVYAEAYNEGVANERDRVGAFMAFVDIDPEAVAKGIEDGKPLSQKAMAELSRKALSKEKITEIKADGAPAVTTTETEAPKTKEEKELDASISKVAAQTAQMLGLPAQK